MFDIPNYYDRAVALLASQFQGTAQDGGKTNFQKMLYAIITQCQEIQTQINLLYTMRNLTNAVGVQLDGLGQILGLLRIPGQSDDDYRQALEFQIFINSSDGTPEEVIHIIQTLTEATMVWYMEIYPAAYLLTTNGLAFPADPGSLATLMQDVSPAGVKFIGLEATYGEIPFAFSNDPINSQFFVAANQLNPTEASPFQVTPFGTPENFFVNRGETKNPTIGGGFAEAEGVYPSYTIDSTGAGHMVEVLQT